MNLPYYQCSSVSELHQFSETFLENLVRDHLQFASNMKRISVTLDRLKYFTFYNQITKRGYYPLCLLQSATSNHLNDFNNMPFRNSLTTWHCHMANIHKYKKNLKNIVPIRTKYNEIKKNTHSKNFIY